MPTASGRACAALRDNVSRYNGPMHAAPLETGSAALRDDALGDGRHRRSVHGSYVCMSWH